jgi:hypothetical protein
MKKQNKLIVDDCRTVLVIQPKVAKILGRSAALLLQQIHYWLSVSNDKIGKIIDGEKWIYNSAQDWTDQLQIFSLSTIKRAINKLKSLDLIKTAKLSKKKSDQTNWYTINYNKLLELIPNDKPSDFKDDSKKNSSVSSLKNKLKMNQPQVQNEPIIETKTNFKDLINSSQKPKNFIKNLIEVWNQEIQTEQDQINLNSKLSKNLNSAFKIKFGSNFEKWQIFCKKIKSNDWLMGRVNSDFKLSIDWVLKFDTIDKIQQGYFDKPFTKENNLKTEGYEDDKIISKDEVLESVKTFERNNLIKDIKFKIIERVGEKAYHSWFSHNNFELKKDSILIKPHNVVCKEHIELNYNKVLKDLNLEVMA